MRSAITRTVEVAERYRWTCMTCGANGWSKTHRGAVKQLHTHWRSCPDPRPGPEKR